MPIIQSEIEFRLSGGAGNADPNASQGGVISATTITTAQLANLFADIPAQEAQDGSVKYRGLYIINTDPSITWTNVFLWKQMLTPSANTVFALSLATEGLNTTMQTIADEDTAPVGQTFTEPTTKAAGLDMGDIPAGQFYGVWLRRTVTAGAEALALDNMILEVEGETTQL